MLEILRIKNFAIIDQAVIPFKPGLNILSGETGAGKSIVIEAISLLLGSRARSDLIRKGCEEAVIEGLFQISTLPWILERLEKSGFPTSELLIKRIVHRAGRHRIFVNGELATLTLLQSICEGLIDLCGQHEHQSLLSTPKQMELLDQYGGTLPLAHSFEEIWSQFQSLFQERDLLQNQETERAKKVDFLKFQIEEIQTVGPIVGEDEALHQEKQLFQSAALRVQTAETVQQILDSDDSGILNQLQIALQKIRTLHSIDPGAQSILEAFERSRLEAEEASLNLHQYLGSIEVNSEKLQQIQERLSLLANLRRKYGNTIPEILGALSELETELASLNHSSDRLLEIETTLQDLESELRSTGKKLSQARRKISSLLSDSVTAELKDLKMEEAFFSVELTEKKELCNWSFNGADGIQFLIQTNRGEELRPIGKIASGGELSRLMLSIRRVIANQGGIGVYLFDEIDAGIGGQTAFKVGKKLKSVAQFNQVICITHLPQVAAFADHHLIVQKTTSGKRTLTEVKELSDPIACQEELARMLAGPQLTPSSLENALELLSLARGQIKKPKRSVKGKKKVRKRSLPVIEGSPS